MAHARKTLVNLTPNKIASLWLTPKHTQVHLQDLITLERLLLTRFLVTVRPAVPGSLEKLSSSILTDLTIDETPRINIKKFLESIRKGDLSKIAQFWLLYLGSLIDGRREIVGLVGKNILD